MNDLLLYSVKNISQRKTRSFLTTLSILIGIMAIFAILSFGMGLQDYVNTLAEEAGNDKFFLQAKGMGAPGISDNFYATEDDIEFIRDMKDVKKIVGIYMSIAEVNYDDEQGYGYLMGFDQEEADFVMEVFTADILNGQQVDEGDMDEVLLGYNYQLEDKIFEEPVRIRDKVTLKGEKFKVEGFVDQIGGPDDRNMYISKDAYEETFPKETGKYGYAVGQAKAGVDTGELADEIEEDFRRHKEIEEGQEDFYVMTFSDTIEAYGNIFNVLNGVLVLIALVSMLVAFVNIMNTMYTAVIERTREIGIMKAIGASRSSILFVFLFESALLGLIGGIIGIGLGYGVASVGGQVAANAGYPMLQPAYPLSLIIGCPLFATIVGGLAGYLPARQASRLNPVDALRSEE